MCISIPPLVAHQPPPAVLSPELQTMQEKSEAPSGLSQSLSGVENIDPSKDADHGMLLLLLLKIIVSFVLSKLTIYAHNVNTSFHQQWIASLIN